MKFTIIVKRTLVQHAELIREADTMENATEDVSHEIDTPMHNARLQKKLDWYNADVSATTILGAITKD